MGWMIGLVTPMLLLLIVLTASVPREDWKDGSNESVVSTGFNKRDKIVINVDQEVGKLVRVWSLMCGEKQLRM